MTITIWEASERSDQDGTEDVMFFTTETLARDYCEQQWRKVAPATESEYVLKPPVPAMFARPYEQGGNFYKAERPAYPAGHHVLWAQEFAGIWRLRARHEPTRSYAATRFCVEPVMVQDSLEADPLRERLTRHIAAHRGDYHAPTAWSLAHELREPEADVRRELRQMEAAGLIRRARARHDQRGAWRWLPA